MSRRARIYLSAAGAVRHMPTGLSMLAAPWWYSSAAFIPIFNWLNVEAWGWLMLVVGLVCVVGAATRNGDVSRSGMIGSATLTAVLALGLTFGLLNVWAAFVEALGWDRLLVLILSRPRIYPPDLAHIVTAPASPFLPLLMLALAIKDFTICAQPMRTPLEDGRVELARLRKLES